MPTRPQFKTTSLFGSIRSQIGPVVISLALVAAITAALQILTPIYDPVRVPSIYLIPVLVAATRWGRVPAIVAAFTGIGSAAFFFYPPKYSFHVADEEQVISLVLFTVVALVTSQLASNVRRQAAISRRREIEVGDLYAFSRRLAGAQTAPEIYTAIQDHLAAVIGQKVVIFGIGAGARVGIPPGADADVPDLVRHAAIDIAAGRESTAARTAVDPQTGTTWLVRPVLLKTPEFGVIAVKLGSGAHDPIDQLMQHVDTLMDDAATTLERLDIGRALNEARLRSETNLLRDALIGSVSHELRTPLASILGAATALIQAPIIANEARLAALAAVARDEAERLNNDIQNLLDATRISAEAIRPHLEWTEPADVINAAIERKFRRLSMHRLEVQMSADMPLVHIDPILLQQAIGQILDNAVKYSASGATIRLTVQKHDDHVTISIADWGEGLTEDEKARLGERFFRGSRHTPTISGSGLGLWIAQAFVGAIGGTIAAVSSGRGQGTTVTITLPIPEQPAPDQVKELDE